MHKKTCRLATTGFFGVLVAIAASLPTESRAQPIQPGEAFVTRFSGVGGAEQDPNAAVIDVEGTVGSIIDVRSPKQPPQGQHWVDEPQRQPLKAGDVGQVFGVAFDGASPPNIYVTATPAFGLHRTADNADWMPGMWGPGGPGAVYRLSAANGYRPTVFAQLALAGRQNSGASLGNIAFDRWNNQFFVSDLETGMIHRLRASDGADLGVWDHGVQGRSGFVDAENKSAGKLDPIPFDPSSRAQIQDCPSGTFSNSPECWNFAASGRRVWGLGVMRDAKRGQVRLFYAVWSSPVFGNQDWNGLAEDEKRNSVWSVRIGPDGNFAGDVRREFLLPDFFVTPPDIARAGYSQPVSDISFPTCGNRAIMLVAERGGIRNLGLTQENPFAEPHEARLLRFELDHEGIWRAFGRYDVGHRERTPEEGPPTMQANCAGGAAFGYGYNAQFTAIAPNQPDQFVWASGDALCSGLTPCNTPGVNPDQPSPTSPSVESEGPQQVNVEGAAQAGDVEVHGIQGIAENAFQEVAAEGAFAATAKQPFQPKQKGRQFQKGPPAQQPGGGSSTNQAYMIDTDINIDQTGNVIEAEVLRNDATKIGDIAIYQICDTPTEGFIPLPVYEVVGIGHAAPVSHSMYESHGRQISHYRFGSHSPYISHNRWRSHYRQWSHYREGSHHRWWSHERRGSVHTRYTTHYRYGSFHNRELTHRRLGTDHNRYLTHRTWGTAHDRFRTHQRYGSAHSTARSHERLGSVHNRDATHQRVGSQHSSPTSHLRFGSSTHNRAFSHERQGSRHLAIVSHQRYGSAHNRLATHRILASGIVPGHTQAASHLRAGSVIGIHPQAQSHAQKGSLGHKLPLSPGHNVVLSKQQQQPPHTQAQSHAVKGSAIHKLPASPGHNPVVSKQQLVPKHTQALSHAQKGSQKIHTQAATHALKGSQKVHTQAATHAQKGSQRVHTQAATHAQKGSQRAHTQAATHAQKGSQKVHTQAATHAAKGSQKVHQPAATHALKGSQKVIPR